MSTKILDLKVRSEHSTEFPPPSAFAEALEIFRVPRLESIGSTLGQVRLDEPFQEQEQERT